MIYEDRSHAGRILAHSLTRYAGRDDVVVLGLARGGVPVAAEVARALGAPLDALVVKKLGVPGHEELAFGAVASGGDRVINDDVVRHWLSFDNDPHELDDVEAIARQELAQREARYHARRPAVPVGGKTVILVDDGLATGATMRAAVSAMKARGAERIIVAAPVGAADTCEALERITDEVVCPRRLDDFFAVGIWYVDFGQTTDAEVIALLGGTNPTVATV